MTKNSSKILFLMILALGTLLTVSSNSWLGSWMGLEINLMCFIPLMSDSNNMMSNESTLKYFLTQALASSTLLLAIILMMWKTNMLSQISLFNKLPILIMITSLLMKSGAAPFHFWFPGVMEGISWMNALILMTWQKLAPLMLISYMMIKYILILTIITSVMVGSIGGLNQTSLRKLMAFSSINHIGWMLAAMISSTSLWLFYFIMYSFLSINMIILFSMMKMYHFNQMFNSFFISKPLKFISFMNLLSLGGLPPFLGFLPKWMVIQTLTLNNQMSLMTVMTIMTLITLYFYLRMTFSAFMLNYYENNWMTTMNINYTTMIIYLMTTFMSLNGLWMFTLMYT